MNHNAEAKKKQKKTNETKKETNKADENGKVIWTNKAILPAY